MIDDIRKNRETFQQLYDSIKATDQAATLVALESAFDLVVQLMLQQATSGGKLIFIGNGGSAAIASHMATDFVKNARIRAMAFNDGPLLTCLSNDFGYPHVFEKAVEMYGEAGDVLVAISSSGQSENILRAAMAAQKKAMRLITLSGFDSANPLRSRGEINFYVPSLQYGFVEVIHHSICHCILDVVIQRSMGKNADQPQTSDTQLISSVLENLGEDSYERT